MELRRRLARALALLAILVAVATVGFRVLGHDASWLDALYMVVISLTSVGYGEIVDTSTNPALRLFNIAVLIGGIGVMLYVFSLATAFVVEGELGSLVRRRKMARKIDGFSRHVIVCGVGETGANVIQELGKVGRQVVALDLRADRLDGLGEAPWLGTLAGDATDPDVLDRCGLARALGVVTTLPLDKDNLVVTVVVRQKYPDVRIVARHAEAGMGERMLKAGASATVSPTFIGGMRLASEMVRPSVVSFLDTMLRDRSSTLRIDEVGIPSRSAWAGREIGRLDLRGRFGLACLAVRSGERGPFRYNPAEDEIVREGDTLVVLGEVEKVEAARATARET